MCNVSNEGVEEKVESKWAKGITLKNAAINLNKRNSKTLIK